MHEIDARKVIAAKTIVMDGKTVSNEYTTTIRQQRILNIMTI